MSGRVILAGAGCSGVGGLTVDVVDVIREADVILYDDLLADDILALNQKAEWIFVGKRKGHHSLKQDEINEMLVEQAKDHDLVVRLKGGDPFVFGRGMEEVRALRSHNIEVGWLPGISSIIGVTERAGIPLTDRIHASSFTAVTASRKDGTVFGTDAQILAKLSGTLVVLMGFTVRDKVARELIESGKDKDTPTAILSSPDIAHTQVSIGRLKDLGTMGEALSTPALIVIGDVVKEYVRRPTVGFVSTDDFAKRVSKYLPEADCRMAVRRLVREREEAIPKAQLYAFTSRTAARLFLKRARAQKMDFRSLPEIAVIGPSTAQVFEEAGIFPDHVADSSTESLKKLLTALNKDAVLFRSHNADNKLETELAETIPVQRVDLYELVDEPVSDGPFDYVVYGSGLEAKIPVSGNIAVAISPLTAKVITGFPMILTAGQADARYVAEAIRCHIRKEVQ